METDLIAGQQLKLRCERRMAECMGRTALRLTSAFPERPWNLKYVRWESKNMCLSNNRISLTPSSISVSAGPPFSRPGVTTGYENGTVVTPHFPEYQNLGSERVSSPTRKWS